MQHLNGEDEVIRRAVRDRRRALGRVGDFEADPVADTGLGGVLAGGRDGRLVEVVAMDDHVREGAADGDGGDAFAAADLGDAHGLAASQAGVDLGQGREPVLQEVVDEDGPGERRLQVVDGVAAYGTPLPVRNASATAGSMRPASATNAARAVVLAGLSASSRTWACASGSA